jgi:hypothetical protein
LRFEAERSSFSGLDLAGRFRHIHQTNLWGADGSVSGLGSESDATANLRQRLPGFLRELGATSLLSPPCGDGGWISDLDIGAPHTAVMSCRTDRCAGGFLRISATTAGRSPAFAPSAIPCVFVRCIYRSPTSRQRLQFQAFGRRVAGHDHVSGAEDEYRLRGWGLAV